MSDERPSTTDENFRVNIGRANKGKTFVWVVHIRTGKERHVVGIGDRDVHEVAEQLIRELHAELAAMSGQSTRE